jgi:hypothetical protein
MTERRSVRRAVLRDLGGPGQELPAANWLRTAHAVTK